MDSILQLKTLIFSFGFGCFFFLLAKYNMFLIKDMRLIKKYLITLILVVDSVLLYVYLMFKINHGQFHIYFFLSVGLGFWLMYGVYPKIKKLVYKYLKKLKL